jgi:hypothetical protein
MNELDMKERGISPDALVEIESVADDRQRRVARGFKARPYAIPQGSIGSILPGNRSIASVVPPRSEKQNPGGQINPGAGQAAMTCSDHHGPVP